MPIVTASADAASDAPVARHAAVFRALGDPVRCAIVEHLSTTGEATVNEVASLFTISLQAVSKHIKVLEAAGVVTQARSGRHRPVSLSAGGIETASTWLADRTRMIDARYDRLDDLLAEIHPSRLSSPGAPPRQNGTTP